MPADSYEELQNRLEAYFADQEDAEAVTALREELKAGTLVEVAVKELKVERNIRLIYPSRRQLSHAAKAFLDVVKSAG